MASRARYVGRRSRACQGIPDQVHIPKFVEPAELDEVRRRKRDNPHIPWEDLLQDILRESKAAMVSSRRKVK